MMKRGALFGLGMLALTAAGASAQVGIGVRASTLGLGGEVSYRASRMIGLRVGGNVFNFDRDATIEDIDYDVNPRLKSFSAIVELHPFGGSFHLAGGLVRNSNKAEITANLNGPITIGSQTYTPDQVGSLTGLVDYDKKVAPYAGLGFSGRGRVSLLFDIGVVFSGHPQVSLTGGSGSTLPPQAKPVFDANVAQEVAEIQADINDKSFLKYHPVVSLGLRIGF